MTLKVFLQGMKDRFPGGQRFSCIQDAFRLYREHPDEPFYKIQLILNTKAYFYLAHYFPLTCYAVEHCPPVLYHVTSRPLCSSIFKEGLHNEKTSIVFLTDSHKYISNFLPFRNDPVVLRIDAKQMLDEGYTFFCNGNNKAVYTTYNVPAKFISLDEQVKEVYPVYG